MEEEDDGPTTYEMIAQDPVLRRLIENARMQMQEIPVYEAPPAGLIPQIQIQSPQTLIAPDAHRSNVQQEFKNDQTELAANLKGKKQDFALTPNDEGYFNHDPNDDKYPRKSIILKRQGNTLFVTFNL